MVRWWDYINKPKRSDQTAEANAHIDHIHIIAVRCKLRGIDADMDQEIHGTTAVSWSIVQSTLLKLRQQMWMCVCVGAGGGGVPTHLVIARGRRSRASLEANSRFQRMRSVSVRPSILIRFNSSQWLSFGENRRFVRNQHRRGVFATGLNTAESKYFFS